MYVSIQHDFLPPRNGILSLVERGREQKLRADYGLCLKKFKETTIDNYKTVGKGISIMSGIHSSKWFV